MRVRKPRVSVANGEMLVSGYLARLGLAAARFDKAALLRGWTPDFRVMNGDLLAFYCEVKTVQEDDWLEQEFADASTGTLVGGSRPDPTYNRISNHIHSAAGQFEAANGGREYPNVLAFVNHDLHAGVQDLVSVLTGNAYTDSGSILPWYRAYSEGRIRQEKERIHLYLWIDVDEPEPRKFWMQSHEAHHLALCAYLGIDAAQIKQI